MVIFVTNSFNNKNGIHLPTRHLSSEMFDKLLYCIRPSHRYTLSGQYVKDNGNRPAGVYISKGKKIWVR